MLTRGTVHETAVPRLVERQKLAVKFVFGADHNESFQMLAAGKADAFANDDVQLYGMLANTRSASDFRVVGDFLTYADYALTMRKDDPEFAEVVERAFHRLAGSREIVAIYERWFMKPLPSGVRLNLPMSPHLEESSGAGSAGRLTKNGRTRMPKTHRPLYRSLYFQVICAIVIGVLSAFLSRDCHGDEAAGRRLISSSR